MRRCLCQYDLSLATRAIGGRGAMRGLVCGFLCRLYRYGRLYDRLYGSFCWGLLGEALRFIISESKEILQWLFGSNLLLTLLRMSFLGIIYVYIVFSTCLDSEAVLVRLIEDFNYSFIVILNQSSVMHQLNASFCQLS